MSLLAKRSNPPSQGEIAYHFVPILGIMAYEVGLHPPCNDIK